MSVDEDELTSESGLAAMMWLEALDSLVLNFVDDVAEGEY